jgi:Lon protease-like protein
MIGAFADLLAIARRADPRVGELPALDDDPARASFQAAAVAPIGPLDAQRVLCAPDAPTRLALLAELLHERAADLRAQLPPGD